MQKAIRSWRMLGSRSNGQHGLSGVDLALTLADGSERLLGIRAAALFLLGPRERDRGWTDGYEPISTDFDPGSVKHWNFDQIFWLGPSAHPCLIWTNAESFTEAGIDTILAAAKADALLLGKDGRGLPLVGSLA